MVKLTPMSGDEYPGKSAYYGQVAAQYDEDRVIESLWALEQDFVQDWAQSLAGEAKILDVPTGTGRFLELFHSRGLQVTGLDVSADMVAEVHRRYPGISTKVQIGVGDAEHLALPDDAVDYLISWRFFHLIPVGVIDRVLREFHRVCSGTVVVQVFGVQPGIWRRLFTAVGRRVRRRAVRSLPAGVATPPACPWAHIGNFSHTEPDLLGRFRNAGFRVERSVTLNVHDGRPNRVYFLRRAGVVSARN